MVKSRLIHRLALLTMVAVFVFAIAVLVREFRNVSPQEFVFRLAAIPRKQLLLAIGLTAMNYLLLTGYDFLAVRYVGQRLRFRAVLFASFTAFAISKIGVQFLSGGATRYRIYKRYGLDDIEVTAIIIFCTIAYYLGVITVGGFLALTNPVEVASLLHIPQSLVVAGGVAMLGVILAYFAICALWRKPIAYIGYHMQLPSLPLAIVQVALASIDAVAASTVIYVLLPEDFGLSYQSFLPVYLIAATASVLSSVPSGLGVFESAMTVLTAPPSKAAALGTFVTYRMIYFIAPIVIALIGFALHEACRFRQTPTSLRRVGNSERFFK